MAAARRKLVALEGAAMNNHNSEERTARVEGVMERVLRELGDLKDGLKETRAEPN